MIVRNCPKTFGGSHHPYPARLVGRPQMWSLVQWCLIWISSFPVKALMVFIEYSISGHVTDETHAWSCYFKVKPSCVHTATISARCDDLHANSTKLILVWTADWHQQIRCTAHFPWMHCMSLVRSCFQRCWAHMFFQAWGTSSRFDRYLTTIKNSHKQCEPLGWAQEGGEEGTYPSDPYHTFQRGTYFFQANFIKLWVAQTCGMS